VSRWSCTDCDWASDDTHHYCPDCGARVQPDITPESLADKETKTDKV